MDFGDPWQQTYAEVKEKLDALGGDKLLFRGHGEWWWPLSPGLARATSSSDTISTLEPNLYFEFVTRSGDLLPPTNDTWSHLFAMQHYGMPTRLLDWTETFGVALFFALKAGEGDAAIWILDPYELNRRTLNRAQILHPHELNGTYDDYYLSRVKVLPGNVVAIWPLRHNPRVFHQRAGFTLHDDLNKPLDVLHPDVLQKITIPAAARRGAKRFLELAGISEFSLFPDLEGLARELKAEFFSAPAARPRDAGGPTDSADSHMSTPAASRL